MLHYIAEFHKIPMSHNILELYNSPLLDNGLELHKNYSSQVHCYIVYSYTGFTQTLIWSLPPGQLPS